MSVMRKFSKSKMVLSPLLAILMVFNQGCSLAIWPEKMVPVNLRLEERIAKAIHQDVTYLKAHFGSSTRIIETGPNRKIYVYSYKRVNRKEAGNGYIKTDNGIIYKSLDKDEKISTNKQIRFWTYKNEVEMYYIQGFQTMRDKNKFLRTAGVIVEAVVYTGAIAFLVFWSTFDPLEGMNW